MKQLIDFKGLELDGGIYPTDIDGIIEYRDSEYIILEVKHHKAKVPWGQRLCLQRMVDNPDKPIVAAFCNVRELYYGGEMKWRSPDEPMTVRQAVLSFRRYSKKQKGGKK